MDGKVDIWLRAQKQIRSLRDHGQVKDASLYQEALDESLSEGKITYRLIEIQTRMLLDKVESLLAHHQKKGVIPFNPLYSIKKT